MSETAQHSTYLEIFDAHEQREIRLIAEQIGVTAEELAEWAFRDDESIAIPTKGENNEQVA